MLARKIVLPSSKILFNLIGNSAQIAYDKIGENDKTFYWLKVQIPAYENLNNIQQMYIGKHRCIMHVFIEDARYMEFLKIPFSVKQIIASEGLVNSKFQTFCQKLIDLKKTSRSFASISKMVAVCGLGVHHSFILRAGYIN